VYQRLLSVPSLRG